MRNILLNHLFRTALMMAMMGSGMWAYGQDSEQHGDWSLGVGTSYRSFDDVEFKDVVFPYSANTNPNAGPAGVQGYTDTQFSGAAPGAVIIDFANYTGSDSGVDSSDEWSLAVGLERAMMTRDKLTLSLVMNLQYYEVDISTVSTDLDAYNKTYGVVAGDFTDLGIRNDGFQATTSAMVAEEFDMKLTVVDVGVKADYRVMDTLKGYVAAGPTLNIANIKSSRTMSATWDPNGDPAVDDPGQSRFSRNDDDTNVRIGAYCSLGVQYAINGHWAVGLEGRYNEVFGSNPGTDLAEIDLDGFSGQLKVLYSF